MGMYADLGDAIKKAKKVSVREMSSIESEIYVLKRKYCGTCKFLNQITRACSKGRIVKQCFRKHLRNKE